MARKRAATKNAVEGGQEQPGTDDVAAGAAPAKATAKDEKFSTKAYERELKKAGVPVDMRLYDTGGHAFGVRKQGKDTDRWTDDALAWLRQLGML